MNLREEINRALSALQEARTLPLSAWREHLVSFWSERIGCLMNAEELVRVRRAA